MSPAPRDPLPSGAIWDQLEARILVLEEGFGHAPNLATGDPGDGLQMVLAREVAARREAEARAATYKGVVYGIAAALPTLTAMLAFLRAVGVLR